MEGLKNLLKRIEGALGLDNERRAISANIIESKVGFKILPEEVFFKDDMLQVKATPAKRTEIKFREAEILSAINSEFNLKLRRVLYI